jgi:hypothetical protein
MFTTNLTLNLKPNSTHEFTRIIENDITPLLRKQKGFRDEIGLAASSGTEAQSVVFFDTKADAEAYEKTGYPEVLRMLSKVIDGTPKLHIFDVVSSTFHKIAATAAQNK